MAIARQIDDAALAEDLRARGGVDLMREMPEEIAEAAQEAVERVKRDGTLEVLESEEWVRNPWHSGTRNKRIKYTLGELAVTEERDYQKPAGDRKMGAVREHRARLEAV